MTSGANVTEIGNQLPIKISVLASNGSDQANKNAIRHTPTDMPQWVNMLRLRPVSKYVVNKANAPKVGSVSMVVANISTASQFNMVNIVILTLHLLGLP